MNFGPGAIPVMVGQEEERFPRISRRHWLAVAVLAIPSSGCGTIFWPERKGQPPGPLDPKVVILDAIGLLFFFIPGVIAFAVDFNNGTIYLPPGEYASHDHRWKKVPTGHRQLMPDHIEAVVQAQTGKAIRLRPGSYRATRLESVESLDDLSFDQLKLAVVYEATDVQFRCQSE